MEEADGVALEGCSMGLLNVNAGGKSMSMLIDGFNSTVCPRTDSELVRDRVATDGPNGTTLFSDERKREPNTR